MDASNAMRIEDSESSLAITPSSNSLVLNLSLNRAFEEFSDCLKSSAMCYTYGTGGGVNKH